MVDHVATDRDAGVAALAARGRAARSAGRIRGATVSAYEQPLQHLGVDAPADRRRALAGARPTGHDRVLLRRARRAVARPTRLAAPTPREQRRPRPRATRSSFVEQRPRRTCCPAPSDRRLVPLGAAVRPRRRTPGPTRSTRSSTSRTSTRRTATCTAHRAAIAYRLRSDESGYDNLVLAGDWTDNGLNAGCIEAATISGLQAANAVLGRSRKYRVTGPLLS